MKIIGLDGKEYSLKKKTNKRVVSSGHERARKLLKEFFPFFDAEEEVFIPGCKTALYIDLIIFRLSLAFEIDGEQHRTFVPLFHGTIGNFRKQIQKDREKDEWCRINGINLIRLPDSDTDDDWRKIIRNYTIGNSGEQSSRVGNETGDLSSESPE